MLALLTTAASQSDLPCSERVPVTLEGPLKLYPNLLNITKEEQMLFYPIVKFLKPPAILNLTGVQGSIELSRKRRNLIQRLFLHLGQNYTIGKYDEDRASLYSSALFQNENNIIDGFDGARTVHVGIDLGGPIGTKVYSFMDGVVSSVGYNKELGDYGCVIVVKYDLNDLYRSSDSDSRVFYALYGHLDWSIMRIKIGQTVLRGEILGRIGDVHLNGGKVSIFNIIVYYVLKRWLTE